ncbi:MAG: hypothetical protein N3F62_06780 [Bacteroidia bacterium]|nr:hypothetical protein [Bacteroidia bacterium]
MFDSPKWYRQLEWISLIISFLSIVLIFVIPFFSLILAISGSFIASIGMLVYSIYPTKFHFSKILLYSLLISSIPILILFFRLLKF